LIPFTFYHYKPLNQNTLALFVPVTCR